MIQIYALHPLGGDAKENHTELNTEDLKALHHVAVRIKELYKDREAPVKPFYRDLILATCHNV